MAKAPATADLPPSCIRSASKVRSAGSPNNSKPVTKINSNWLWDLAPDDLPRLTRATEAYEKRYPNSERAAQFRARLNARKRRSRRKGLVRFVATCAVLFAALAGYDAMGYQSALSFAAERDNSAPAVARRWSELMIWHPSMSLFWPTRARNARLKLAEWTVKAAEVQVANGTDAPESPRDARQPQRRGPQARPRDPKDRGCPRACPTRRALEDGEGRCDRPH